MAVSGDTRYRAVWDLPEFIEKGKDNVVEIEIVDADGWETYPVAATSKFSLFNASGNPLIDEQAISGGDTVRATYTIPTATIADESFGLGWRVEWQLVFGSETITFRREAGLVLRSLYPALSDTDLIKRHPDLDRMRRDDQASYGDQIEEAWVELQTDLIESGNRVNLIMSPFALKRPHRLKTLEIIYRGFHATARGDSTWLDLANDYRKQYLQAMEMMVAQIDSDEDGIADSDTQRHSVQGTTFLGVHLRGRYRDY